MKKALSKKTIKQIQTVLQKEPSVIAAYVFGSYQEKTTTKESDFDLAIIAKSKKRLSARNIYGKLFDVSFPKDLDVSIADKGSSPLFLFQIISKGFKIYEKDHQKTIEFEAFVMHNYYDTQHIRNVYSQYLKDKFSHLTYAS